MRLAFYSLLRNGTWGGSENLWYKTALYALKNNHEVIIILHQNLSDTSEIHHLESLGATILIVQEVLTKFHHKLINKFYYRFSQKHLLKEMLKKVKSFSPNVLLINQPGGYDILYNSTAYKLVNDGHFKYHILTHSYSIYDILSQQEKSALTVVFQKAKQIFFVANKQANYIMDYLSVRNKNCVIVSNPLNLKERELINYPLNNRRTIKMAMVTTLFFASKGIDSLIKTLSKPTFHEMDWQLEIFGTGPDQAKLEQLILDSKLTQKVRIMGFSNEIEKIWAQNEILLMPSRVDAAPAVLLEAMACGRTAVCTNIGFCDEWIEHKVNGFISSSVSQEDFEIALLDALENRDRWKEMGKKCHQLLSENHPRQPEKLFLETLLSEQ